MFQKSLILALFIGQLSAGTDDLWKIAAQSGFNAILVLVLLYVQQRDRDAQSKEREKYGVRLDLLTKAVTEITLSLAFLPPKFHADAQEIQRGLAEIK